MSDVRLPGCGLLLDLTAILTLGSLNAFQEMLNAFKKASLPVYLFPGCMHWMEKELEDLRFAQLPMYRNRFLTIHDLLLRARDVVDIRLSSTTSETGLTEDAG